MRTGRDLKHAIDRLLHFELSILRFLQLGLHFEKFLFSSMRISSHQLDSDVNISNLRTTCCTRQIIHSLSTRLDLLRSVLIVELIRLEDGRESASGGASIVPSCSLLEEE
jgi:hypothetical protein